MPGPLIRPPTKKQIIIGSISLAVAIGIMGLAGSTGRLASEVQRERQLQALASASPTPLPTSAAECQDVISELTDSLITAQDALREAAQGGDYSTSDLEAAADTTKDTEAGKAFKACQEADAETAAKVSDAIEAIQDAADAELTEENAPGFLAPVAEVLVLA